MTSGTVWFKTMLLAAAVAAAAPRALFAQEAVATTIPAPLPDNLAQHHLDQLVEQLHDTAVSQVQKDELARRLVQRPDGESHEIVRNFLIDPGNRGAQLAITRALASNPTLDPTHIDPLFALMGTDRALTDAAAEALACYKRNLDILARLMTRFAAPRDQRDFVRVAAVHAVGSFVEKRAAAGLIELLIDTEETLTVRIAAADALVDLTGLSENDRDVERWRQWWRENQDKSDTDWKLDVVMLRAARYDRVQDNYDTLAVQTQSLLDEIYQSTPASEQSDLLLRIMRSSAPAIRVKGPRLIAQSIIEARRPPAAARDQLRLMVGDSSPMVRLAVAEALVRVNDPMALEPILVQIAIETDPGIRRALAAALEPIRDIRAVPILNRLLDDPSINIAETAAKTLAYIGPVLREKDPNLADETAQALRRAFETRTSRTEQAQFRETLVNAMAPLRSRSLLNPLLELVHQREPVPVQRAALRALGELRDPRAADIIATSLDHPDPAVRLDAVNALGSTATFAQATLLVPRLSPREESEAVRDAAWRVLEGLFPTAGAEDLNRFAQHFRDQPQRRLVVLKALADALEKDRKDDDLAGVQQDIGALHLQLDQPAEAVPYLRAALQFKKAQNFGAMVLEGLVRQLMEALLESRQYAEAAAFAADSITTDPAQQQTMWPMFRNTIEGLENKEEYDNALALIAEVKKMNPPLHQRFAEDLRVIELRIRTTTQPPASTTPTTQ